MAQSFSYRQNISHRQGLLRNLARSLSVVGLLILLLLTALPAQAAEKTAQQWLSAMSDAFSRTGYQGVFIYARGDQVSSMQIAHRFRNGEIEERLVFQDGPVSEIVRKGQKVTCVLPHQGRVNLNQLIGSGPFTESFIGNVLPASEWYQPEIEGSDRVAGHKTVIIALNAKDEDRYSYRLWLDEETGLLIKSYVNNHKGEVLEGFQFTSLTITDDLPDEAFKVQSQGNVVVQAMIREPSVESYSRQIRQPSEVGRSRVPASFGVSNWHMGWTPEGFVPTVRVASTRSNILAFSDGLGTFTVFLEPSGDVHMPRGASRVGATTIYMRPIELSDGHPPGATDLRVTVIGEVPPLTAMRVAESVSVDWIGQKAETQ